jgi:hypothetical protein
MQLTSAMSESPLLFFTCLVALTTWLVIKKWNQISLQGKSYLSMREFIQPLILLAMLSILAGLAGTVKLNGFVLITTGVAVCVLIYLSSRGIVSRDARVKFVIRSSVLLIFIAILIFIIVNPYLYPNPLIRIAVMTKFRSIEMSNQVRLLPEYAIIGFGSWLQVVPKHIFQDYLALHFNYAWIINSIFFGLGISYFIRYGMLLRQKNLSPFFHLILFVVFGVMAVPALFSPLNWERYYLFPVIFVTLWVSIGFSVVITLLHRLFVHNLNRSRK